MSAKSFFVKISSGDFGLAKTYWLYWALLLPPVNATMIIVPTTATLVIVALVNAAYLIPVVIGVWRAANRCEGRKIWAVLAMIGFALAMISIVLILIMLDMFIEASGQAGPGV